MHENLFLKMEKKLFCSQDGKWVKGDFQAPVVTSGVHGPSCRVCRVEIATPLACRATRAQCLMRGTISQILKWIISHWLVGH